MILNPIRYFNVVVLALLAMMLSCKADDSIDPFDKVVPIVPTGEEKYLNNEADVIFDQEKLHTFELTISQAALNKIDADPSAEEYVTGSLTFDGETVSPVGIRYKGSIGAYVGCLSGTNWTKPSGYKTCTKLSMKIKINWADPDQAFYGLKKLQFHSQNLDPTQMRERLGYWLFREMGVPAPRSVHARLVINGTYMGVFALTEQIDGRFTRENFANGRGNLYKEIWPLTMNGQPYSEQAYIDHLKTNEDESPSAEMIRTFAWEIREASEEGLPGVISKWMDMNTMMAFVVVDRMIRADDGPFHWYCSGDGCSNHNYYWYEEPSEKRLYLIPWDLDNAFENIVSDVNPVTPLGDDWGEISNDCNPFNYGALYLPQRSAACDKLTAGWVTFEEEYNESMTRFLEGPFAEAQVNYLLDQWTEQIRAATEEARQQHNDALSISKWDSELSKLRTSLAVARGE